MDKDEIYFLFITIPIIIIILIFPLFLIDNIPPGYYLSFLSVVAGIFFGAILFSIIHLLWKQKHKTK